MAEPQSNHPLDNNDSSPTPSTKSNTNDERNLIDAFAIRIDLDKLSIVLNPDSSPVRSFELAKIYEFKCYDNDLNKNARLKYQLEAIFLRDSTETLTATTKTTTTTTTKRTLLFKGGKPGGLSSKRTREYPSMTASVTGDIFQQQSFESFLNTYNLFVLNSSTGALYLNLKLDWSSSESEFFRRLTGLVDNTKFVVIKIRVSDHGIVPLYRDYFLRYFFCFYSESTADGLIGPPSSYCDFSSAVTSLNRNRTILVKHLSLNPTDDEDESEDEDGGDDDEEGWSNGGDRKVLGRTQSGNNGWNDDEDGGDENESRNEVNEFRKHVNNKNGAENEEENDDEAEYVNGTVGQNRFIDVTFLFINAGSSLIVWLVYSSWLV